MYGLMALTHGSRLIVITLVIAMASVVLFWGSQQYAQAEETTLAGQILCYINSVSGPPIPRFHVDECPPPEPPPPPTAVENTLPLCSDGADNDGDSHIDLADSDCSSFSPKLVVVKTVINDNGGITSASDFPLYIGRKGESATTTVLSGVTTTIASGIWVVGEISNYAYVGTFGGACNASGEVTLAIGDTKTCTITNDDMESPPPPPPPPPPAACADGVDNDSDGLIDAADAGCSDTSDTDETNTSSGGTTGGGSGSGGGGGGGGGGGRSGATAAGLVFGVATTSAPLSPPAFQGSCDTYLTAFIRSGFKNDESQVRRLQTALRDFESAPVSVNGVYDAATLAAVHVFQTKYTSDILTPWGAHASTGYVYLTTRKKVNEIYCRNTRRFDLTAQELATIEQAKANAQPASGSGVRMPLQTIIPNVKDVGIGKGVIEQTAAVQEAARKATGKGGFWRRVRDLFRIR